jgi:hypothetical protein
VIRYRLRVDFYQDVPADRPPSGYVGSLLSGDFAGPALPRGGDSVSAIPLGGGHVGPWTGGPYMLVHRVEHHPVPVDLDGHIVDWWEQYPHPSVHVVVRAEWPEDETAEHELMDVYDSQGWTSFPAGPENPFLPPTDLAVFG